MARKLYVGNMPFSTEETDLRELFASAGTVESVTVMRDQATGRARGFGFVEMATDEDAQNAIKSLNNYQYGGRNLTVNEARPKTNGGGFGGGRGGNFGGGRRSEPRW
ncbi:MAG: RNA-binding protein [Acidobacteriota bacterium]